VSGSQATALRALLRKELAVLFGSPIAYVVLTMVTFVTAFVFFEHLRAYNQILFLYASSTMGGFESGTIPDHINLRDTVFNPVMDQLSLLLIIPLPLVTMRVFAEERARGTEELLLASGLRPGVIVVAKYAATLAFVALMMAASFVYPLTAMARGGLGGEHLAAVFLGLLSLAVGIAAIGLACSAFTSSQILAAAGTVALAFGLYDFGWSHGLVSEGVATALDAVALRPHFVRFAEGIVALSDLCYFAGFAAVSAALARLSLQLRRVTG
jgi:ABC-2 type transport system permease protein